MVRAADEDLKRAVGERLSLTRDVVGLTQREVAQRAGMNTQAYSMVETGERPLHIEDAIRLRDVFKVDLDWIYCGETAGLKHELATIIEGMQRARKIAAEAMAGVPVHQDRRRRRRYG
jgi:transcriptional regulator with XRE-family HTH domain